MIVAVIASLAFAQIGPIAPAAPAQPAPAVAVTIELPELKKLATDELIKHLPPARAETVRDVKTGAWTEDPAAKEFRGRDITPEQLGAALNQAHILRSSPRWFENMDFAVWLRCPEWLAMYEVTATPRLEDAKVARAYYISGGGCGNAMQGQLAEESYQVIGRLPAGTTHVTFDVSATPMRGREGFRWSGTMTLPVTLIPQQVPVADDSKETTAAVKEALRFWGFANIFDDGAGAHMETLLNRPPTGLLQSTIVNLDLELLMDGKVVFSAVNKDPDEHYDDDVYFYDTPKISHEVATVLLDAANEQRFSVHVRGRKVEPGYVSQWCRTKYWTGEFSVPLQGLIERR